jgi:hypothetical protein
VRRCGACSADPTSATGCSKACQTAECDVDVVDCAATACGVITCPPGLSRCGNACRDLSSDPNHCGACSNACPAGGTCELGSCFPTPEVCGACTNGSQTCCHFASSDQKLCGVGPCALPGCAAGAVCAPSGSSDVCTCPAGQTCSPSCGPPICEVNWLLCLLFPGPGCLPQCQPGLCTIDSFCM